MAGATYPDGWDALLPIWEKRRAPLTFAPGEALPELDTDLGALVQARVPDAPAPPAPPLSDYARKSHELALEFAGQAQIFALHGVLISCLRRRSAPAHTAALFRRLWAEQSGVLIEGLPTRWLISAVITFGDHGATESERLLGRSCNVLFSLIKLYEFERRFSGHAPDQPFAMKGRSTAPLPLGLQPFSLKSGGLDINLLAPLWQQARDEPVLGPLVGALFERLNSDNGTVFRRLTAMRARLAAREARRNTV